MAIPPYPYYPPRHRVRTLTEIVREQDPDYRPPMSGRQPRFVFSNGRTFSEVPANSHPYDIEE